MENSQLNSHKELMRRIVKAVASICEISEDSMFSKDKSQNVAYARWFCWYAMRMETGCTYKEVADAFSMRAYECKRGAVGKGVPTFMLMMMQSPLWRRRYEMLQSILGSKKSQDKEEQSKITVTVKKPKNIKVEVKFEEL